MPPPPAATDGKRFYVIDGVRYPSVTTILQVIAKPGLMYFYGRLGVEGAETKKLEAADIGSLAHHTIEKILKGEITSMSQVDMRVNEPVQAFFDWRKEVGFEPIEQELTVHSKKLRYAGTLDTVGFVQGRLAVVDFKTSNRIWPEYGLQIAAYKHAYEEMTGKKVKSRWVIRLDKKKPFFEARAFRGHRKDLQAFKAALKLWYHLNPKVSV